MMTQQSSFNFVQINHFFVNLSFFEVFEKAEKGAAEFPISQKIGKQCNFYNRSFTYRAGVFETLLLNVLANTFKNLSLMCKCVNFFRLG